MNVYDFIYCFFCRFWGKKIGNGRIIGAAHVAFAILMHMLFISEVIRSTLVQNIVKSDPAKFPIIRDAYWLFIMGMILIIYFIYNPDRTYRLLKEYNVRYSEDVLGNILRILFYIILPTTVGILLALIRKRAFL